MAQPQYISFVNKIYKEATPTDLIEKGDTVKVRLRAGCNSCAAAVTGPNVPSEALGCDPLATQDHYSFLSLYRGLQDPCVGEQLSLTVLSVTDEGRGFTYDRLADDQHVRPSDIDMVMPMHAGVNCAGSTP